jgi:sulfate adenylyltransferase subunit 1
MIVKENNLDSSHSISAQICWLDDSPLVAGKTYKLQHGVNESRAKILGLEHRVNIESMLHETGVSEFKLNDIGEVKLKLAKPIMADPYRSNRRNGAFILIDMFTNNTVGIGFVI